MNLHIINIIIKREYLNRVKKKSFLLITFLGPIFFAAMCILPTVIMMGAKEEAKTIAVVDQSGIVLPVLEDTETIIYKDFTGSSVDELKADMASSGVDAVLSISALDSTKLSLSATTYSSKPLGMDMTENIESKINDAVEDYRINSYNIDNLKSIMKDVKSNIHMTSYTISESGDESISESGVYMLVSMLLGMIIYMFIAIFGGMVMSSVIEEKASRVVEVLVSSVKATELMFGKIIGVALVALTQFLLWIVLTLMIVAAAGSFIGKDLLGGQDPTAMVETMGVSTEQMEAMGVSLESLTASPDSLAVAAGEPTGMEAVLGTLSNLNYGQILISFFLFFIFGYLLYASLFAAIGSAVENEGDTQQLQIPLTIPLLLGFFIALYAYKAPDSALVFWGSMIPFTSPIVMLARIPFGVAFWELAVSIVLLIATVVACAYISAKIYKVGILMYGKKSTWKDLWKWLKMK
ncbi:MAG: ABC transporter permease [Bacteroidales bacterium]|nr:ABC transporter permease [Bacteroidales bacterium]